jgi:hypothetical protein
MARALGEVQALPTDTLGTDAHVALTPRGEVYRLVLWVDRGAGDKSGTPVTKSTVATLSEAGARG